MAQSRVPSPIYHTFSCQSYILLTLPRSEPSNASYTGIGKRY